jgi:hypothetical protein
MEYLFKYFSLWVTSVPVEINSAGNYLSQVGAPWIHHHYLMMDLSVCSSQSDRGLTRMSRPPSARPLGEEK